MCVYVCVCVLRERGKGSERVCAKREVCVDVNMRVCVRVCALFTLSSLALVRHIHVCGKRKERVCEKTHTCVCRIYMLWSDTYMYVEREKRECVKREGQLRECV